MGNWLLIGGTSGIAIPLARELVKRGHRLYLTERENALERCREVANDLQIRAAVEVMVGRFEAMEPDRHGTFIAEVEKAFGELDGVIWVAGVLLPQADMERDPALAQLQHAVNYTAAITVLTSAASIMAERGRGMIVGFCSPAGDRIRKSNFFYGIDKQALEGLLEGLRLRFGEQGIKVVVAKPGPTATPMTAGLPKQPLLAQPEVVAKEIAKAIDKGCEVVYAPGIWRWIMLIIRNLPEFIFRKLSI
ncbi:MAG: SDR family NAD(P)-dependent oxidoreductase [bacterium]|nr:SDR family NAD(P)-dependent oxidoreductase [bacterium]